MSTDVNRCKQVNHLMIDCDGASVGNQAGCGIVIYADTGDVFEISEPWVGTNNDAEWKAVCLAIKEAVRLGAKSISLRTDSNLVVEQLNQKWKIRAKHLIKYFLEAVQDLKKIEKWSIHWIPREMNTRADRLSKLGYERGSGKKYSEPWRIRYSFNGPMDRATASSLIQIYQK